MSHTVVDVDAHYLEDVPSMAEYLDEPWKTRLGDDESRTGTDSAEYRIGKLKSGPTGDRYMSGRISRDATSYPTNSMTPDEVPQIMARVGIDKAVLISQKMLGFGRIKSAERQIVLAKGFAEFMINEVTDPSQDIYSVIMAPYRDPEAAVELIDEYSSEKGIIGVCMNTPEASPVLGNRKYDPIYEAAESAGLPVIFHGGGIGMDSVHFEGFTRFIEGHTVGFLTNNVVHLTSLVVQGIPEKFPDLDIIFEECGIFWVPMIMNRLDAEYMKRQSEAPLLTKRPSEYIKEFYYGTQPLEVPKNEQHLEYALKMLGNTDNLMYASDYPHWDYDEPSVITDREFLSEDEKARILGGAAEEVFGI